MIIKKYCTAAVCATAAIIITVNAQEMMLYVKSALELCYSNVIPSLFVFMVLSSYLGQAGFSQILSIPFTWYSRIMKIQDRKFACAVLLSLTGGFVGGAGFLKEFSESGYDRNCLKTISPVLINNSFSFCFFAVGIGMLGNMYTGIMLFISLTAASLITGFMLSFYHQYNIVTVNNLDKTKSKSFVDCVNSSVKNILSICGFVVIFYVLCKVLSLYTSSNMLKNTLYSLMEVTCRCSNIALNSGKNSFFICAALSFYPLSTLCQVFYFTDDLKILKALVFSRFIHTPVSLVIFTVLCNLFPVSTMVLSPENVAVKYFYNTSEISVTLFMIILSFLMISDRKKLFTKTVK